MTVDPGRPARILIVDDEPLNLDLLQQELEDRGYEVELAEDGEEALERVAAQHPDLILLDVIMPRLDGIETCRRLKNNPTTAHIPIVIMTALSGVEDRIRGIRAGADDFLTKPVDDRELIARIETALRTKRAVDETRDELESARQQLEIVGKVDRDATVLLASGSDQDLDRIRTALANAGGHELTAADGSFRWLFLDTDPVVHPAQAARALTSLDHLGDVAIALESGSTLVAPERADEGTRWETSTLGPAADMALDLLRLAPPGGVVVGPEAAQRLEGAIETAPLPQSEARLLTGWAQDPARADESAAIPWPSEYGDLLDPLRDAWDVEGPIYLTNSLSGKSGARVYLVDITTSEFSGQAILKLDQAPDKEWDEQDEARRHLEAIGANTDYAGDHLPQVVHSLTHGEAVATLSSIAGRGLEYVLPWAHIGYDHQVESATHISLGILRDWNSGYELSDLITPPELLDAWLTYRLDPQSGRINAFLEGQGVEPTAASFIHEGVWFPNPLAFAREVHPLPHRASLRAAKGSIHGDFHGFNVLMPSTGQAGDYYVIDLAFYERNAYLLFDNAYFELAHLLHTRETIDTSRWLDLLAATGESTTAVGDDLGLIQIVAATRSGVMQWIDEFEPNRLAYMESQHALARVAVGLNFVNKRVSHQIKLLSLLYAASNLKAYLAFQAIDWPVSGPVLA
jgi:DNA-binding response OmpR family regulator